MEQDVPPEQDPFPEPEALPFTLDVAGDRVLVAPEPEPVALEDPVAPEESAAPEPEPVAPVEEEVPQVRRRRLSVQSPCFGVFARAAAEAAANTPVLEDPYWVPPTEDLKGKQADAKEKLRKVAILVLSGAEEGLKLSEFMDSLEQLHPQAKSDMSLCNFASVHEMIQALKTIARIGQSDDGEERVFALELPEDEFESDGEVVNGRMTIKVDRSLGLSLGLSVAPAEDQMALEILEVADGLVKEWCQKKPQRHVYKGDRIVAVNQMRGSSRKLVEFLRQDGPLVLSLLRGTGQSDRAPPRGGRLGRGRFSGGPSMGFKGKGRGSRQAIPPIPGAAAKSASRRTKRSPHRGRSRSRRNETGRRSQRSQARRRNSRRKGSRSNDGNRKDVRVTLEKISRRAVCGICMEPLGGTHGTLDLRKCGHPVHAQCLVGLERDEEGHPRCEACNFQMLHQVSGKNSHSRKDRPNGSHKKRKRRSSSSRRKKSRERRSNSSSSSSRSDSSGEGDSSSEDSKPPGLLTAIRGTSRFCAECGQHMGWVEKLTPSAMQSAPKALCNVCQAKKEKAEKSGAKVDKVADEIMEVDEWGFQMAMDQVAEASCPEDAAAVLEALLKSKPCEDFLKAGHWTSKLADLVKEEMKTPEEGCRRAELVARLAQQWRKVLCGQEVKEYVPSVEVESPQDVDVAGPMETNETSKEEADEVTQEQQSSASPPSSERKGFLWELLQKARQKTKDKIAAALPLSRRTTEVTRPPPEPKPSTAPWVGPGPPGSFGTPAMYPWAAATQPLPY